VSVAKPDPGEQEQQCCWRDEQTDTGHPEYRQRKEGEGGKPYEIAGLGPRAVAPNEGKPEDEQRPEKECWVGPLHAEEVVDSSRPLNNVTLTAYRAFFAASEGDEQENGRKKET